MSDGNDDQNLLNFDKNFVSKFKNRTLVSNLFDRFYI